MTSPKKRSKNFYLSIVELIKKGDNPAKVCSKLNISKQRLNYYMRGLKANGYIQKIGYGVWKVKKMPGQEVKISTGVGSKCPAKEVKKLVRGHGYHFTLRIPKLRNWGRRVEYLDKKGIDYKLIPSNKSQRIVFKGHKVWLTNRSVVIYFPRGKSYFAGLARDAKSYAIYDFELLVRGLEGLLNVSFAIGGKYVFRTSKAHYSLVKNALAKQYDREEKKLNCHDHTGFWLCIDNSYKLNELETLHPESGVIDNELVQKDFNELKEMRITRKMMVETFDEKVSKVLDLQKISAEQLGVITNIMGLNAKPVDDGKNKNLQNYFG